jgi:F-type H+-transporting ATPase subunit b
MKNITLVLLFCLVPISLFANEHDIQTDILERSVNFLIFVAILYYLLANKAKEFFGQRTTSIQNELDNVQKILKESKLKEDDAKKELENAKKIAKEIVDSANCEIDSINSRIEQNIENEISHLIKSFEDKIEVETKKAKKEIVKEILDELLKSDNIKISQNELSNIVLKKVA